MVSEYFGGDRNVLYRDCSGCFLGLWQSKLIKSHTLDRLIHLIICKLIKSQLNSLQNVVCAEQKMLDIEYKLCLHLHGILEIVVKSCCLWWGPGRFSLREADVVNFGELMCFKS